MKKVIFLLMILNVLTPSLMFGIGPEKNKKEPFAGVSSEAMEAFRAALVGGDGTDYDADADEEGLNALSDEEEEPDLDALPDIDEALGKIKQVLSHGSKEEKAELSANLAVMIIKDQE